MTADHLLALERGEHVAYERSLRRIARALNTTFEYLETGRELFEPAPPADPEKPE